MAGQAQTLRQSISAVLPGLRYVGLGVWAAWLFLISNGSVWLFGARVDEYLANLMLVFSFSSALVCIAAPFLRGFFERLLRERRLLMRIALFASAGALGIIASGPFCFGRYVNTIGLFWLSIFLTAVFSGVFALKCGQLFGALDPKRVLLYSLLSELLMVVISYFVLSNNILYSLPAGPPLSGVLAFVLLPPIAAYLVCLPAGDNAVSGGSGGSASDHAGAGTGASAAMPGHADCLHAPQTVTATAALSGGRPRWHVMRGLPSSFWKFLCAIFVFTLFSETMRCYNVHLREASQTYFDSIAVLFLRAVFALLVLLFALAMRKQLRYSRIFLVSYVGIAIAMSITSFLQINSPLFDSLIGLALNVITLLVWCLLANVSYEKHLSPIAVFGFGRGALLLGQTCSWLLGILVMPMLAGTSLELVCFAVMVVSILVMLSLFFSEREFDRLFGEIAVSRVELDASLIHEKSLPEHRPWQEACQRAGEQARLSSREMEIFRLLVSGRSPENIAAHLVLSLGTVRTHIRNIYAKFDVHSKTELVLRVEAVLKE